MSSHADGNSFETDHIGILIARPKSAETAPPACPPGCPAPWLDCSHLAARGLCHARWRHLSPFARTRAFVWQKCLASCGYCNDDACAASDLRHVASKSSCAANAWSAAAARWSSASRNATVAFVGLSTDGSSRIA